MIELPLANPITGYPGAIWPRSSVYRSQFQDPVQVRTNLKLAQKAYEEDNLDNLILQAIEEVYKEVKDGPEDSENFTEIAFSTTEDKKSTSRKS